MADNKRRVIVLNSASGVLEGKPLQQVRDEVSGALAIEESSRKDGDKSVDDRLTVEAKTLADRITNEAYVGRQLHPTDPLSPYRDANDIAETKAFPVWSGVLNVPNQAHGALFATRINSSYHTQLFQELLTNNIYTRQFRSQTGWSDWAKSPTSGDLDTLTTRVSSVENTQTPKAVGVFNVLDYGAKADGSAEAGAAIQATIDAAANDGGEVRIPRGTYLVDQTASINIPSGARIVGFGATLNTTRNRPVFDVAASANNVSFQGLTIKGNLPADKIAVIQAQVGIRLFTDVATPITNVVIKDCKFIELQGTGIQSRCVRKFKYLNNDFIQCGYAGIGNMSVNDGLVEGNFVEGTRVLPNYAPNSYGIFHSTLESKGDVGTADNPLTTDIMVRNNYICRQAWTGLDTHVGRRISFVGNTLYDCPGSAIGIVHISMSGVNAKLAPRDIVVENNTITYPDIVEPSSLMQVGIVMRGSTDVANPDRELVTGTIKGNLIRRMGTQDSNSSAGILVAGARAPIVQGNNVIECRSYGISIRDSYDAIVDGNAVTDVWKSNSSVAPGFQFVRTDTTRTMVATFTNNRMLRGNLTAADLPSGAVINSHGVHGSTDSSIVLIESGNDFNGAPVLSNHTRITKTTGNTLIARGTAAPTGSRPDGQAWSVGDRVDNSTPANGQPQGWICTTAGTPGTWLPYGRVGSINDTGSGGGSGTVQDTGELLQSNVSSQTAGRNLLRRTGNTVFFTVDNSTFSATGAFDVLNLPDGFRPKVTRLGAPLMRNPSVVGSIDLQNLSTPANSKVVLRINTANDATGGVLSWSTSDAWPATYPGTAV